MAGALRAGSVYVAVSAAIGDFVKGLTAAVKATEVAAKKIKESAEALANVGAIFAAGMTGAVLAAAQSNRAIQADMERLKAYLYTLAADIGDAFRPALRALTQHVAQLVGAFQRLRPELRESVAEVVVFLATLGAGAAVLGRTAGLVEGLAKATGAVLVPALGAATAATKALAAAGAGSAGFPAITRAVAQMEAGVLRSLAKLAVSFGAVLLPIAAVTAAIAALALLAGTLYEAWEDTSTGLKATVLGWWESLKSLGAQLAETMAGWFTTLRSFVLAGLAVVLDVVARMARDAGSVLGPLARGAGLTDLAKRLEAMGGLTGTALLGDLTSGAEYMANKAREGAAALQQGAAEAGEKISRGAARGLEFSARGLRRLAADTGLDRLPERLKNVVSELGQLFGAEGRIRSPFEDVDVARVGRGGALPSAAAEFSRGGSAAERAAFDRMKAHARRLAEEAAAAMAQARESIRGRFAAALGQVGETLEAFAQGVAAFGGPQGGIAAVAADLLTRSAGFRAVLEIAEGALARIGDALGAFLAPLEPVIAALFMLVDGALTAIAPALNTLSGFVAPLVPPLVLTGRLFQALAPALAMAVHALALVVNPMQLFAGPILKGLFEVLKMVGLTILHVVRALGGAWNGIINAIQTVFRKLADISVLGKKPLGFLDKWADGLDRAKIDTDALAKSIMELNGLTWEAARQKAEETAAVLRNRQALDRATEALSNVPNAWKVALARFEAQDPQQPPVGSGGPVPATPEPPGTWAPRRPPPGGVGTNPGGNNTQTVQVPLVGAITINAYSPEEALARAEGLLDKLNFRRFGTRGSQGRYGVQGG